MHPAPAAEDNPTGAPKSVMMRRHTPPKEEIVPMSPRVLTILALLALAALGAGCGGSSKKTLDPKTVGKAISDSIVAQHGVRTPVNCPQDVEDKKGTTFHCAAKLDVGSYDIPATVSDDKGHVTWKSTKPFTLLDIASVESAIRHSIRDQRDVHASVVCPKHVLQQKGLTFTCKATLAKSGKGIKAGTYGFKVTETDDAGHVTYVGV